MEQPPFSHRGQRLSGGTAEVAWRRGSTNKLDVVNAPAGSNEIMTRLSAESIHRAKVVAKILGGVANNL
jgi:hypothetical protein